MWCMFIAPHDVRPLTGHRVTSASDQGAALSGPGRGGAPGRVTFGGIRPGFPRCCGALFFLPAVTDVQVSFLLTPRSVLHMAPAAAVHTAVTPNSTCHPENLAEGGLCEHPGTATFYEKPWEQAQWHRSSSLLEWTVPASSLPLISEYWWVQNKYGGSVALFEWSYRVGVFLFPLSEQCSCCLSFGCRQITQQIIERGLLSSRHGCV